VAAVQVFNEGPNGPVTRNNSSYHPPCASHHPSITTLPAPMGPLGSDSNQPSNTSLPKNRMGFLVIHHLDSCKFCLRSNRPTFFLFPKLSLLCATWWDGPSSIVNPRSNHNCENQHLDDWAHLLRPPPGRGKWRIGNAEGTAIASRSFGDPQACPRVDITFIMSTPTPDPFFWLGGLWVQIRRLVGMAISTIDMPLRRYTPLMGLTLE